MEKITDTVLEHSWKEQTYREPMFQVAFGIERTCQRCQRKQFSDYTSGRTGGGWVEVVVGVDGESRLEPGIDTSTGCNLPDTRVSDSTS